MSPDTLTCMEIKTKNIIRKIKKIKKIKMKIKKLKCL